MAADEESVQSQTRTPDTKRTGRKADIEGESKTDIQIESPASKAFAARLARYAYTGAGAGTGAKTGGDTSFEASSSAGRGGGTGAGIRSRFRENRNLSTMPKSDPNRNIGPDEPHGVISINRRSTRTSATVRNPHPGRSSRSCEEKASTSEAGSAGRGWDCKRPVLKQEQEEEQEEAQGGPGREGGPAHDPSMADEEGSTAVIVKREMELADLNPLDQAYETTTTTTTTSIVRSTTKGQVGGEGRSGRVGGRVKGELCVGGKEEKTYEAEAIGRNIGKGKIQGQKKKPGPRGYAPPELYEHLKPVNDLLREGLDIVFCGINPGKRSSTMGHHFSHPTNKFWRSLFHSGLTSRLLDPTEDQLMPQEFNYGLTNLVDRPTSEQSELSTLEMRLNVYNLTRKFMLHKPKIVCFVGKKIWDVYESVVAKSAVPVDLILGRSSPFHSGSHPTAEPTPSPSPTSRATALEDGLVKIEDPDVIDGEGNGARKVDDTSTGPRSHSRRDGHAAVDEGQTIKLEPVEEEARRQQHQPETSKRSLPSPTHSSPLSPLPDRKENKPRLAALELSNELGHQVGNKRKATKESTVGTSPKRQRKTRSKAEPFEPTQPRKYRLPHDDEQYTYFWVVPNTSGLERTQLPEQILNFTALRIFLEELRAGGGPLPLINNNNEMEDGEGGQGSGREGWWELIPLGVEETVREMEMALKR